MFGFDKLTFDELLLVLSLIALIAYEFFNAYRSRSPLQIYRPTLFVAGILAYYVLFGPLQALATGEGLASRGLDHRNVVVWGWLGALLFYGFLLLGFHVKPSARAPKRLTSHVSLERIHRLGILLCQIGFIMFTFVGGTRVLAILNPFAARSLTEGGFGDNGFDVGALANYFNYAINFLIPGILLQFAAWIPSRKYTKSLVAWLVVSTGIYISLGFRYRLVLLFIPLIMLWYLARLRRPNALLVSSFIILFIVANGVIGLTRSYGRGLDLSRLENNLDIYTLTNSGVSETSVFLASSGVMEQTPSSASPFVGLEPMVATLLFPIPRVIWPSKPDNSYLSNALEALYGGSTYAAGSAIINYAEYYLIAGFPSLIIISFIMGYALRRLWNWFLVRYSEPMAQCIYLLSASYVYVAISRGYMPQVFMLFFFSVYPLFWLYGRWSLTVSVGNKVLRSSLPSTSPTASTRY